ncbi:MAG: PAS domain-containing protein [Acidobacteriota bacterium]|nr:PAS domain-containing protein [Acidobacteriota bacterium]
MQKELLYKSASTRVFRTPDDEGDQVILKQLREAPTEAMRAAFRQEYRITRAVRSEGVVRALDLRNERDTLVMVLEDFGAVDLDHWIRETGCLDPDRFLALAVRLVKALEDIHRAGYIHKDINPTNIVINPNTGQVKIIDMGIACRVSRETAEFNAVLEGTLHYLSPEQTGRINRLVDYRSDFYALGATFYFLLAGRPPFQTDKPMELIHCHLAVQPRRPELEENQFPEMIWEIIAKLTAKDVEDRYQTTTGILADLEDCTRQWQAGSGINKFRLGLHDNTGRLRIPQKVYGRTTESGILTNALEETSETWAVNEPPLVMLISGEAGIGKSVLVRELQKDVYARRGYFAAGKYTVDGRHTPYSGLIAAARNLISLLLTEGEDQLASWRERFQRRLGANLAMAVNTIPELGHLLGGLSGIRGTLEWNDSFLIKILEAMAENNRPFTLFLDNLHRADSASLRLLVRIARQPNLGCCMIIGSFNDVGLDAKHPLIQLAREKGKPGTRIRTLPMEPLSPELTVALISGILDTPTGDCIELGWAVYPKTRGNPFHTINLMASLYDNGDLYFDRQENRWRYVEQAVKDMHPGDHALGFMTARLEKLPKTTLDLLKPAACMRGIFPLSQLQDISGVDEDTCLQRLKTALDEGFIAAVSGLAGESNCNIRFRFVHERYREVIYSMIPAQERASRHLKLGRYLVAHKVVDVDELVRHFNRAGDLITSREERILKAGFNLEAALKTLGNSLHTAAEYLEEGIRSISYPDPWEIDQALAFRLHMELASARYHLGNIDGAAEIRDELAAHTADEVQELQVATLKVRHLTLVSQYARAYELGRELLERTGILLPGLNDLSGAEAQIREAASLFKEHGTAGLEGAPPSGNHRLSAALNLMAALAASVYVLNRRLWWCLVASAVKLIYRYRLVKYAGYFLVSFGRILMDHGFSSTTGAALGKLAMALSNRFEDNEQKGMTCMMYGWVLSLEEPLGKADDVLVDGYRAACQGGDFQYSGYLLTALFINRLQRGVHLTEMKTGLANALDEVKGIGNELAVKLLGRMAVTVSAFTDKGAKPGFLMKASDDAFEARVDTGEWFRCLALLHFGYYELALKLVVDMRPHLASLGSGYGQTYVYFMDGFLNAVLSGHTEVRGIDPTVIPRAQDILAERAAKCPSNYAHLHQFMTAEVACQEGRRWEAVEAFEKAVALAAENGFHQDQALAQLRFAQYWEEQGRHAYARHHFAEAHAAYSRWGAANLVTRMEQRYPWLSGHLASRLETRPTSEDHSSLDLISVLKAAGAISGFVDLDTLLGNMMQILVENAGARRSFLILERNGPPEIAAFGAVEDGKIVGRRHDQLLDDQAPVPVSLIRYVMRTGKTLTLGDARTNPMFANDPYVRMHAPKSIFCLALPPRKHFTGVLYLENDMVTNAFTGERREVMRVLLSQASISLENAFLHDDLTHQVANRKKAEIALDESEERFSLFMKHLPGFAFMKDENHRFLYLNEAFDRLYGTNRNRLIGKSVFELTTPEEARSVVESDDVVLRSGKVLEMVEDMISLDGKASYYLTTKFPIPRAGKSPILGSISVDITQLKKVEEELKKAREELEERVVTRTSDLHKANQLLSSVIDHIPISIFWKDLNSVYQGCNANFAREALKEGKPADVIGKTDFDMYDREDVARAFQVLDREVINAGKPLLNKEENRTSADHKITLLTSKVPLRNQAGEVTGVLGIYLDITERKRLEENEIRRRKELDEKNRELEKVNKEILLAQERLIIQEKMASLGTMAAGVAHEIRNPLNFIQNMASICVELVTELREPLLASADRLADEDREEILAILGDLENNTAIINKHGKRAGLIVQSINQLAGGSSGKPQEIDINALVSEYTELAEKGKRDSQALIQRYLDERSGRLRVIPHDLGRVIINLVNNALDAVKTRSDHQPEHQGIVKVSTTRNGDHLAIRVRDNGTGIAPEYRSHIFEPLFTTKPSGQGNIGMGLALCYDIVVQEHGGELNVSSEVDEFTEFTIKLPLTGIEIKENLESP